MAWPCRVAHCSVTMQLCQPHLFGAVPHHPKVQLYDWLDMLTRSLSIPRVKLGPSMTRACAFPNLFSAELFCKLFDTDNDQNNEMVFLLAGGDVEGVGDIMIKRIFSFSNPLPTP